MEFPIQATITHDIELNGNQSVSFSVIPTKVNKPFIDEISEMWEFIDTNNVVHKVIYCSKRGQGNLLNVEIKAIPLFYDTMDNSRIYEEYNEHMTAQRAFARIFEDMPFGFVLGGQFDAVEWEGFGGGETRLETFKRSLERYKAEFKIVGDTVYLEHQIGRDTSFMYRYKLNASNIVKEVDAGGYWTYGVGYGDYGDGDGGEDWESAKLFREYTSPLAKIIGKRHAPPIKNGNITNRSTMYETIKTLVDESLKISITTDIHDLRRQGYALAQPEVGDRVFIMDERIGLDEEVRVIDISVTKDWRGNILDLKLTIGSESLTKRHQSDMSTAVDAITDLIEGRSKLPFSVLDDAVKNATKALKDAQTELSFGKNGILAKDVNNPNLVTLLNSAGVGVSDDGGNTFKQAITGRGINASAIVTGTMVADFIAGGTLTSLNGATNFDMDNGLLSMENTNFILGGKADIVFTDYGNRLYYNQRDTEGSQLLRSAGVGFGRSINDRFPYAFLGTSTSTKPNPRDDDNFNGFITNTYQRRIEDGIGNSVVGHVFQIRDKAVSYNKGFQFDLVGNTLVFRGISSGSYNYHIGETVNQFSQAYIRDIRSDSGYIRFRNSSSSYLNQGFTMETKYDGDDQLSFRGTHSDEYYNLGKPGWRFSYLYLKYDPEIESDERLKTAIRPIAKAPEIINKLKPIKFRFKQTNKDLLLKNEGNMKRGLPTERFGFSAQQVESVLHELGITDQSLVNKNSDNYYGMQNQQIIPLLVADNQDLRREINEIKEAIINEKQ